MKTANNIKRCLIGILMLLMMAAQTASAQTMIDGYYVVEGVRGGAMAYKFSGGTDISFENDSDIQYVTCNVTPGATISFECITDGGAEAYLTAYSKKDDQKEIEKKQYEFELKGHNSVSFSYTVPKDAGIVKIYVLRSGAFSFLCSVTIEFRVIDNNPFSFLSNFDVLSNFDEHTTATGAAVVGTVGTLLALLLGGLAGGAGGAIPLVPPVSSTVPPTGPASPIDPTRFTPTNYPDYCEKFITQQPDGDVVMRSPATGQSVHYYSNGDGTWFSDSGMTYTAQDIEERLRYEAENAGYVQQNAETAARNVAEQRAAWEAQNARDLARGYSNEMKEYADWKQKQENQVRHEEYLEKMSWKYHVPPTDKAIKDAIKFEQAMNRIDADTYTDLAKQLDKSIGRLQTVETCCDFGVGILGSCVPGGGAVKNAYTFAKSTLVAASESFVESKSLDEAAAHILIGMGDGALGVIQNEAGDLAGKGKLALVKEWGINVLTEDLKEGMKVIADNETWKDGFLEGMNKLGETFISTTGKKTAGFGLGKVVSGGLGFLKDTATVSLNPDGVEMGKFCFNVSTAKRIDNWLNKTMDVAVGGKYVSLNGTIEKGNAVEEFANNVLSWVGFSDKVEQFGSDTANWINDKSIDPLLTVDKNSGAIEKAFADYGATCNRIDVWATNYKKG